MGLLSVALPQTLTELQRESGVDVAAGVGYGCAEIIVFYRRCCMESESEASPPGRKSK